MGILRVLCDSIGEAGGQSRIAAEAEWHFPFFPADTRIVAAAQTIQA